MARKTRRRGPREARMAATREALIQAGLELFGEEGLDGPSLDAICERAGYTRGAFYVHFEDRDEFLEACMERVGPAFLDAIIAHDAGGGLALTFQRFVRALRDGSYPLTRKGGVKPHQLLEACARSKRIRDGYVALVEASMERVAEVVKEDQRQGTIRDDLDAPAIAAILHAAVVGVQTLLELGVKLDVEGGAADLLRLLRRP